MDRIIEVKINGTYVSKDCQNAGSQGEANVTALRIEFDEGWDGFAKTITWWDAKGENPKSVLLTADNLEDIQASTRIYLSLIPAEALAVWGKCIFCVDGYSNGKRQKSAYASMLVKPRGDGSDVAIETPAPSQIEQLQGEIDTILEDLQTAINSIEKAEAAADRAEKTAAGIESIAQEVEQVERLTAEAKSAKSAAEASAAAAADSAANLAESVSAAAASAGKAASSEANAESAKAAAESAKTEAANSASAAAESARLAAESKTAASLSASSAASSEAAAASSAQSASADANSAASSAQTASDGAQAAEGSASSAAKDAALAESAQQLASAAADRAEAARDEIVNGGYGDDDTAPTAVWLYGADEGQLAAEALYDGGSFYVSYLRGAEEATKDTAKVGHLVIEEQSGRLYRIEAIGETESPLGVTDTFSVGESLGTIGDSVVSWDALVDRPFGEERIDLNVLPETEFSLDVSTQKAAFTHDQPIEAGKVYAVKFNGVEYICEAVVAPDNERFVALGRTSEVGGIGTLDPFLILYDTGLPGNYELFVYQEFESIYKTALLGIDEIETLIHKIDEKFLPEGIGDAAGQIASHNENAQAHADIRETVEHAGGGKAAVVWLYEPKEGTNLTALTKGAANRVTALFGAANASAANVLVGHIVIDLSTNNMFRVEMTYHDDMLLADMFEVGESIGTIAFTSDASALLASHNEDEEAHPDIRAALAEMHTPDVSGQIATHNTATDAHADIRQAISTAEGNAKSYTDAQVEAIDIPDVSREIADHNAYEGSHADIRQTASDALAAAREAQEAARDAQSTADSKEASGTAAAAVSAHNEDSTAHADIRQAIENIDLSEQINTHNTDTDAHEDIRAATIAADSKASAAQTAADNANSAAGAAAAAASGAQSTADEAKTAAATAKSTADTAQSTADTAQSTADTAKSTADKNATDISTIQNILGPLAQAYEETADDVHAHVTAKNNPHSVTANQVGAPTVQQMNDAIAAASLGEGGGTGGASSWDDLGKGLGIGELLQETTLTATNTTLPEELPLTAGYEYTVRWNGTEYVCTAKDLSAIAGVEGAAYVGKFSDGDTEPFFISYKPGEGTTVSIQSGSAPATVSVSGYGMVTIPIPGKYLPEGTPWLEEDIVEVLPTVTPTVFVSDYNGFSLQDVIDVKTDDKYIVNYNGTEYECVAGDTTVQGAPITYLGDLGAMNGTPSGSHPFFIAIASAEVATMMGMGVLIVPLDGSSNVTFSIKQDNSVIHKLDNRCLDLAWLPTAVLTTAIEEVTLAHSGELNGFSVSNYPVGTEVVVVLDGVQYPCTVKEHRMSDGSATYYYVGNLDMEGDVPGCYTGEPFCFIMNYPDVAICMFADGASHQVEICTPEHNTLPEKFFPDGVFRNGDEHIILTSAPNVDGESKQYKITVSYDGVLSVTEVTE